MIIAVIVACEIGFWLLVLAGLIARYPLRRKRLGAVLLLLTPLVDLLLLVVVALDLRRGGHATFGHALAALYIGISLAHGHAMISWIDERFAYRFAAGPAPKPLTGAAYTAVCWRGALRTVLAAAIIHAVIWGLRAVAAPEADVTALASIEQICRVLVIVDVVWALAYTVRPRKAVAAG